MKIDFNKMEEEIKPNFKGGEKEYRVKDYTDDLNKIMRGRLIPGASIGLHTHEVNSEIIYIIKGSGKTICDGVEFRLNEGDCTYCKKGHNHTLINDTNEDLVFFAVVCTQ